METLYQNKRFIKWATFLVVVLSLLVLAKFVHELGGDHRKGNSADRNVITVNGTGEISAVPNIAMITVNISKDGATTKEAQDGLNQMVTKTLDYLKGQKIDDKDIKSEYGGVNPKYANETVRCLDYPCPMPNQKIIGYTATQSISIKVRAADSANDVRTGLANLGITDISGPSFAIDDDATYQDQARAKAIDDAKEKAKKLAKELGVHLGHITSFSENNNGNPIMYSMTMDKAVPQGAPIPTLPKGENKITSNVTITYEIR
jgi:uncharacterized protein YggE